MHASHPLRIFGISALLTLAIGVAVALFGGLGALWIYAVLVLLEVTFSFDNAVVNSKILTRLSPFWQTMFLTVGIFFAVFVVRFLLPIVIVLIATGLNIGEVIGLAIHAPALYAAELHHAAPIINAFGGAFLVMIGLSYFVDREKDVHWLKGIEYALSKAGDVKYLKLLVMLVVALVLCLTVAPALRDTVAIATMLGILLHVGLDGVSVYFEQRNSTKTAKHLVGGAAFAMFMYLQVLDASFSFDGVIGAFAITTSIFLIMAGLGAGALWVRSLTVYLVRTGTLAKYRYLEHGAHWAILALGIVMLAKLYAIELPEWLTGSLGLIFVATAVVTSVIEKRRLQG
jgi:hypothetical protein